MVKDVIYLNDCRESMIEGFRNGYKSGDTTHFKDLDGHFSFLRKEVSLFGGNANHGKSTLYLQMKVLRAKNNNEKFAFFSPEQSPANFFYNDAIHMLSGKYPAKGTMSEDEYFPLLDWVQDHFYYVYPKHEIPTPDYINGRFERICDEHGVRAVCIDPFNQLANDWDSHGRSDLYITSFLNKCKRFAQKFDVNYDIVGHPNGTVKILDDGNKDCPNVWNIAGGAAWDAGVDNAVFTQRPYKTTDPKHPEVLFRVSKVKKYNITGVPDDITLTFNRLTNRYHDSFGCPFDEGYGKEQSKMFNEPSGDPFLVNV